MKVGVKKICTTIAGLFLSCDLLATPLADQNKTIVYGINYLSEEAAKEVVDIVKADARFDEAKLVVWFASFYSESGMNCIIFSGEASLDKIMREIISKVDAQSTADDLAENVTMILNSPLN